ncbi:ABC transporter ATP-binding protein [Pollutimonas subterranea]|uniref:ABC transporter ATP-binding protein n=1 Tax=Pollutimonas subterranea TaxID=2045210 RepID=A0A2N4U7T7_9BURK|nr:ABC transporter ATP-binding protein [Pollutimonas subterranea]PLC51084.1 ABC transporter ATP-binding protein [Pollutimonas subterranea]
MTEFHVSLSGVTKNYGKQRAVNNMDLTLRAGECVALAGHNGAGKSTLIKLILGLIRPSSGKVMLLGHEASGRAAVRMRGNIGYLPETVALHPSLTGAETLAFYARLKRQPVSANAALLSRVGIAQAAQRRVGVYSKGMRQRLALAQALLGKPKVLLFDEPTTGLDPASRLMFYEIVRELRNGGSTVLLSTHALSELDGHTDRIVVMKNGSKIADGSMSQLRHTAGLPIRIRLKLGDGSTAGLLPDVWQRIDESKFELACTESDKVDAMRSIGTLNVAIDDIEIHTPSLDDMYAHFLRREDL